MAILVKNICKIINLLCKWTNYLFPLHVPRETTYFGNNGSRSTLDQCLVSEGVTHVKSKVLTGEHLPGNLSTHAAVLWTMNVNEEVLPEKKKVEKEEEPENKLFKRFPRVNWEAGIDLDLYAIKEEAYLRVGLKAMQGLPAPWKLAVAQDLLSEALDVARIRAARTEMEDDDKCIVSLEQKIAKKWRELKRRRSGYFSKGDARFQEIVGDVPSAAKESEGD